MGSKRGGSLFLASTGVNVYAVINFGSGSSGYGYRHRQWVS